MPVVSRAVALVAGRLLGVSLLIGVVIVHPLAVGKTVPEPSRSDYYPQKPTMPVTPRHRQIANAKRMARPA